MPFLSLPLEILQHIADCVETVHRPSLSTLSLTSKACHRVSAFLIFRQINITVHHREGLRRHVDGLGPNELFRHYVVYDEVVCKAVRLSVYRVACEEE